MLKNSASPFFTNHQKLVNLDWCPKWERWVVLVQYLLER